MIAKDPVCDMSVNTDAALHSTYQGQTHYFCSPLCKNLFEREPEKFVHPTGNDAMASEESGSSNA